MVKCVECGFLAVRNSESRELEEAEEIFREKGIVPITGYAQGRPKARHESLPLCFAASYNLLAESKKAPCKDEPGFKSIQCVIHQERECEAFTNWQQGFTPKEHREILDRQEFRNWQECQRREDRRWRIRDLAILIACSSGFIILGALIERGVIP